MSLSNAAVSLDCSDNISIATTSTTTSTPIEKEEGPVVVPPKSPSLSPSLPPSLPPSPLLSQPEEKQQAILDSENPLSSPEHPDKQPEETEQEQEYNKEQKGKQAEQADQAEQHQTDSTKSSSATESPLEAFKPKEQVISFDFQDSPLLADDEVDDDEGEYNLSGKALEGEMVQLSKIRGREREPLPGAKRVLKRVRVRKDTSSSKRRTKKHNLRATMNSAVIAEKLAAERGERSGGKEIRKEKKKERLAAVVEWKPIVEPVSKPRARPSGLRFSENCYSDQEDDEGQGSEPTGHKRKREDQDLGDEDDDESLGGSADKYEVPEKRQHQSHPESSTETGTLPNPPCVTTT
ncbi:uncharacterized protein H6S33_003452 [Morchella sextelata]|uniref:uncharacterized protein n=1 Tax=Morchella sextelata TaxID=1174677 RepID=UPI001D056BED|nr:uncharacterized protein H6S33_003452 [Morchella sextelata]KAH0606618.1 hypothetical protein H6S33_003452 [Morchella sextelata]